MFFKVSHAQYDGHVPGSSHPQVQEMGRSVEKGFKKNSAEFKLTCLFFVPDRKHIRVVWSIGCWRWKFDTNKLCKFSPMPRLALHLNGLFDEHIGPCVCRSILSQRF